ncbi:MAG TPA: DUF4167 domain-containing protein [Rhizomicrobium sp.]|nr:DUF4167 domain-containing protein [Rhizomicrobium sp.]
MKRSRGRGRRPQNNNNNPNRTFDSNGPEIKIRGSAVHVYEKYLQLARDANSAGDRVMAENYLQHAEHYYRVMAAAQAQQQQYQQGQHAHAHGNGGNGRGQPNGEGNFNNGASGPSFSLAEAAEDGDDEGDEAGAE